MVWCIADQGEAYKLKDSATRGGKKCGSGVTREGLRKPQNH